MKNPDSQNGHSRKKMLLQYGHQNNDHSSLLMLKINWK